MCRPVVNYLTWYFRKMDENKVSELLQSNFSRLELAEKIQIKTKEDQLQRLLYTRRQRVMERSTQAASTKDLTTNTKGFAIVRKGTLFFAFCSVDLVVGQKTDLRTWPNSPPR